MPDAANPAKLEEYCLKFFDASAESALAIDADDAEHTQSQSQSQSPAATATATATEADAAFDAVQASAVVSLFAALKESGTKLPVSVEERVQQLKHQLSTLHTTQTQTQTQSAQPNSS